MANLGGWGGGWGDNDSSDEGNEEQGAGGYYATKDCLILLIEASPSMFVKAEGQDDIPFSLCIKCARSVLLNKIISSEKDLVGIVLFGTDKLKNPSDFRHVYILQDLDMPDAPRIKQLEDMLEDEDMEEFKKEYGHCSAFSLSDVFWTCSTMLATSGAKFSHRRVLLFTNSDDPHSSSPALQRQAKTKAKDLAENGIEVELMHMGKDFNVSTFYQDIIFAGDEEVAALPNPSEKFEELLTRVRSKEFKKRAMQRISMSLGPGLELGIGVYCMVRESKKPSFIRLERKSNEELKTQTKLLCEDTGSVLIPTDIKYYQEFGGEKVAFEKEEVDEIRRFGKPGMTLLGFKPKSRLKQHHYVKPANFIYPDETVVNGSTKLFSALLQRCLSRDVVAICSYIARSNSSPIYVALVPQEEELDNGVQVSPPGFHVIFLPFAEDVREVELPEKSKETQATSEQIDKAKSIIKKLTFKFQSESFENPVLQKHYRTLEALALEHEEVEEIDDLTQPDFAHVEKRAGTAIEEFKQLVYPAGYDSSAKPLKRKASATAGSGSKKAKSDEPPDVEAAARNGTLMKLTVPVLKEYLTSIGKKMTGKKQELVDVINDHFGI